MPRYYFHLRNDMDVPDELGKELPNLGAALSHATNLVRFEISQSVVEQGRIVLSHRIDVEDESGTVLASVNFREAVELLS